MPKQTARFCAMVVLPAPPFWLTKAMTLAGSFFNVANDLFCWKRSAPTGTHRCSGMTRLLQKGRYRDCFGLGSTGDRERREYSLRRRFQQEKSAAAALAARAFNWLLSH